jgi:hypothetical protein
MAFTPENPSNPQDLFATFDIKGLLTGLIYKSDEGSFSRINGEWLPLTAQTSPFGSGANMVFVSPNFTEEFDYIRSTTGYTLEQQSVQEDYGIKLDSNFNVVSDAITAAAGDACPPATQDIGLNLQNRENAIKTAAYGPLNPARPNNEFWQKKAERWSTDVAEAKSSVCGNCAVFIKTPRMLDCIESGLGNEQGNDAWGVIDAGELGYCEAFDFKCASSRTCDAWVAGGPVTEEK